MEKKELIINGRIARFSDERNLLEVIRKSNINIPTFCYHSELSIYGACRLCIVDIEGKGIVTSCSTKPEAGMKVRTHTREIREIRKIALELILANHNRECTSCTKSSSCKLQDLSKEFGIDEIRFRNISCKKEKDFSSAALVREPDKCILCGDCVRACYEIQGIGAIDFAHRGSEVSVQPAFGKNLADVECVDCGQCARVCPTGAITPKNDTAKVWNELDNSEKTVVAQLAPAVRVALGELFGEIPGSLKTGQIVTALKMLGFDKVYDTSFAADLTVIEETEEFLGRYTEGEKLPLFTSCCPAWVKFAEQYYPELLNNLSSCKSPQQMFGSVAKEYLPDELRVKKENLVVVSIMPCTAKKVEQNRSEFTADGVREVDYVLTTQELAAMIKEAGIRFNDLLPESFDLPFGFKTGAGVIFGNSGGVSEAVLRYASEKISGAKSYSYDFPETRGNSGIRETVSVIDGKKIRIAIVHGLKNARDLIKNIRSGEARYDMVEVMACPGGCIGGAGQPVCYDSETKEQRAEGIYSADKMLQLHKSQENPYLRKLYEEKLGEPGGKTAHKLLHTKYNNRKRILESELSFIKSDAPRSLEISICIGTNCFVKGSQKLLENLLGYIEEKNMRDMVNVRATFCMEQCSGGPNVAFNGKVIPEKTFREICGRIEKFFIEKNVSQPAEI